MLEGQDRQTGSAGGKRHRAHRAADAAGALRDPSYPVLCLPASGGFAVARAASDLEYTRGVLWQKGFFEGLEVIDRQGGRFAVVSAAIVWPRSWAGRWLALTLDFTVRVSLRLTYLGEANLETARDRVLAALAEDPEMVEESSGREEAWWREKIARCRTSGELVEVLSEA